MKILYISPKIPYPLSDGGKLRVFNHIKHLSKKNEVVSLSFIKSKDELKNIEELKKYCSVETILLPKWRSLFNSFFGLFSKKPLRVAYFKDKRFRKKARRLTKKSDLVIIQALRMAQYGIDPKKTILDIVDTPSLQIRRALKSESFIWKLIWKLELPRIVKYEKVLSKKFKKLVFASEPDKDIFGKGNVLKNFTDIRKIKRKENTGNNIMFLGNMEYPPNIDAVNYFVKDIFPLIKKKIKDAKFFIVGKNADNIKNLANRDVVVTGFVEDLGELFNKCKVFVAPMRQGSGLQNKVLEALNYEIPVVTTSIVNAGVEAEDGKDLIVADRKKEFAEKTIEMMKNKKLRKNLAVNGKKFLMENYSKEKVNKWLDKIIKNAISN